MVHQVCVPIDFGFISGLGSYWLGVPDRVGLCLLGLSYACQIWVSIRLLACESVVVAYLSLFCSSS